MREETQEHRADRHEDEHESVAMLLREQKRTTDTVNSIWNLLNGSDGRLGLSQKVAVLWSAHIWVACTGSAAMGSLAMYATLKALGFHQ
jgi:hypothetical protein